MSLPSLAVPLDKTAQLSVSIGVIVVAYALYVLSTYGSRAKGLPPGPPTLPIIGNLAVFPRAFLHFKFTEWGKKYGDIYSLKVMNQTIIVLGSPSAVHEIIDKRSVSTSERPRARLAEMITHGKNFGTNQFPNEMWTAQRKAAMQVLNKQSILKNREYTFAESSQLMFDLARDPQEWFKHVQRAIFSLGLGLVYGRRGPRLESKDIADILYVNPQFINALEFGRLPPVDLFPILTWVPDRFVEWKATVKNVRRLQETMYDELLQKVEARLARGENTPGFMEEAVKNAKAWGLEDRDAMMHLGGVLLTAWDTTAASLQAIVLTMVSFPEAVKKAQAEIDRVVGNDRAPNWGDVPNLPYTMAFMDESLRFRPMGPLGLPHAMAKDEVIDGVLYPKGATIFINTWSMFHDERYFDRPDDFMPERFLNNPYGVKDPTVDDPARRPNLLFGGGRRVCPGMAFSKDALELNVCNLMWAFDFAPVLDAAGKEVPPDLMGFSSGLTGNPLPFDCRITPRSAQRLEVIKQQFSKTADVFAPYEQELSAEDRKFNANYRDL